MDPSILERLASPTGTLPLSLDPSGLLRSEDGIWPLLGGVPFLVPEPSRWLSSRRDAVLAALAEVDRAGLPERSRLDAFAGLASAPPEGSPDDWVEHEEETPELVWEEPGAETFAGWLAEHPPSELHDHLASLCERGPVLEVGCGAGPLTRRLRGRPLVVVDRSLRAVLRATAGTDAVPVVAEAESLPVRDGAFRTIVAANLVDLLDDPVAFVEGAARALQRGGRLVLCSPDPALGVRGGTDEALVDLIESVGLKIIDDRDGVPWVRSHGPRHHEVYFVRIVAAER